MLSDYLDGELDEQFCIEIERHLADCGDCRVLVDTLRRTVLLYREHGHESLPTDVRERLYAVLKLP
jgi:anti-sigma factor RsiW